VILRLVPDRVAMWCAAEGAAELLVIMRTTYSLVLAMGLAYSAVRFLRRKNGADPMDPAAGFRPRIGFTRLDHMESISLLLENGSKKDVWIEEIEIFLSGLSAEEQTTEASLHEVQKVREMVPGGDVSPTSLAQAVYRAAGGPQRNYSCVLSSVLRYRVGEEWFEKQLENYNVRMLGLTACRIRPIRKPLPALQPPEKPQDVPAVAARLK
jgi:hypothetical protein